MSKKTSSNTLALEARQRTSAAVAALLAGVFALAGPLITSLTFANAPKASWLVALDRVSSTGNVDKLASIRTASYEFYSSHKVEIIAGGVLSLLSLIAMAWAIIYLGRAVKARRPQFQMQWLYISVAGMALLALSTLIYAIATVVTVENFLNGPRTVEAAADILNNQVRKITSVIYPLAKIPLAGGFIIVCLNAMRVGLLTKFMGILGMFVGLLFVLQILSPLPIVETFWLIALAALYARIWPREALPAWKSGKAEPWPSRQDAVAGRAGSGRPPSRRGRSETELVTEPSVPRNQLPGGSRKRRRR